MSRGWALIPWPRGVVEAWILPFLGAHTWKGRLWTHQQIPEIFSWTVSWALVLSELGRFPTAPPFSCVAGVG